MNLKDKIQNLCDKQGITFKELGDSLGIGNGVIARWSKSSPSVHTLNNVAKYFNVSLDYLMKETDEESSDQFLLETDKTHDLELLFENLLNELDHPTLTFKGNPIDPELIEVMKSMLKANLNTWNLMSIPKKQLKGGEIDV